MKSCPAEMVLKAQAGDRKATDYVVRYVDRFVLCQAQRLRRPEMLDDLVQAGRLGVLRAIATFKPSKGANFTTWLSHWLRAYQWRAVKQASATERVELSIDTPIGEDDFTLEDTLASDLPSPEETATARETRRLLHAAVLDAPERAVLLERLAGHTLDSVAASALGGSSRENARLHELKGRRAIAPKLKRALA